MRRQIVATVYNNDNNRMSTPKSQVSKTRTLFDVLAVVAVQTEPGWDAWVSCYRKSQCKPV